MRYGLWIALAAITLVGGSVAARQGLPAPPRAGEDPSGYRLSIISFGATQPYVIGARSVILYGVVRNDGTAPQPASSVILRMYAVTGLDYVEGTTVIRLPALEPGATAQYRWKVQPTEPDAPLVAALALEQEGRLPRVLTLPMQHYARPPSALGAGGPLKPVATAVSGGAMGWLDNGRVRFRALRTDSHTGAAYLWARTPTGWRQALYASPLLEVRAAEGSQSPWWEMFKVQQISAQTQKGRASLRLSGTVGVRWLCTITVEARNGSSILEGRTVLTARRRLALSGLRLATLCFDGASGANQAGQLIGPVPVGSGVAMAVRRGGTTAGLTWPSKTLLGESSANPAGAPIGAEYTMFRPEYLPGGGVPTLEAGASLEIRWRLYALHPSATIRDALKVTLPDR